MVLKMLGGAWLAAAALASPDCKTYTTCGDCSEAPTWLSGNDCRFCPGDNKCHAFGSFFNPCSAHENIDKPDECPSVPAPAPVPPTPPRADGDLEKILEKLFSALKITDVDVTACAKDESGAFQSLKDFAIDFKSAQYKLAVKDLGRALSSASNSVSSCKIPEVQQKLDVLAASIRWANISTTTFDHGVKILVDASDLWQDLETLATTIEGGDATDIGNKLASLLDDWTAVTGGCGPDNKACKLVDGLLRALAVIGVHVDGCEAALEPSFVDFELGAAAFKAKNYTGAAKEFATALDVLAVATKQDSCGLKPIGDAIAELSPKLAEAIATVESSDVVKILVGSADVYNELYGAVTDFEKKDSAGVGMHLGALLVKLRASGCQTQLCIVVEGLLGSMRISFTDVEECTKDFHDSWTSMQGFISALEGKQWDKAVADLGDVFGEFSSSVSNCGVTDLAKVLEDTATALHNDGAATIIGEVAMVLVSGADVSDDLQKVIVDAQHQDWAALGQDLGTLSDWVSGTSCNAFVCRLLEGILQEADLVLMDLKPCEASLRTAEKEFLAGTALWRQGKNAQGLSMWASGLNDMAKSVQACGVAPELAFIEREAQVLGLGNLTVLEELSKVIVHGVDFYEELYAAVIAIENKDYRSAGKYVMEVMDQLSKWTNGHLCTSPICYIVNGVLQYLADMQDDIGKCKSDFKGAMGSFSAAYHVIVDESYNYGGVKGGMVKFTHNSTMIKEGILDISYALKDLAAGIQDCHLAEFAEILEQLAEQLGFAPQIQWVEELIKILIEGHDIENEIADVCHDYATDNYPSLGYDLVKLAKSLLKLGDAPGKVIV